MRIHTLGLAALALVGGCDFSGDFLFPGAIEGVPGVLRLTAEDGEPNLVPFDVQAGCEALTGDDLTACNVQNAQDNTIYVELGPTGDANPSGVTLTFEGTGGSVCIFSDPELVYWNQAVSVQGGADVNRWRFPDNSYDDGDVDLTAGLSVYYTGTEGERMGNFAVQYQDSLGNTVPIDLVACTITASVLGGVNPTAHSGRGAPEFCTIANTQPGVAYTVALEAFSLPPDDNRLMMGLMLADGGCNTLINAAAPPDASGPVERMNEECLIRGEAIPGIGTFSGDTLTLAEDEPLKGQLYYGFDAIEGLSWPGSIEFEDFFCSEESMRQYCAQEATAKDEAGLECNYTDPQSADEKCFCGDRRDTPTGGAF